MKNKTITNKINSLINKHKEEINSNNQLTLIINIHNGIPELKIKNPLPLNLETKAEINRIAKS